MWKIELLKRIDSGELNANDVIILLLQKLSDEDIKDIMINENILKKNELKKKLIKKKEDQDFWNEED